MTSHANQRRREVSFEVGDYVYLKLQPYRQTTVTFRSSLKLSPRFYGPFQILSKVSLVAYRLDLPKDYQIHDVFHVSLLRKHLGSINHASIITTSSSHKRFFHYSSTCFHIGQAWNSEGQISSQSRSVNEMGGCIRWRCHLGKWVAVF